MIAIQANGPRRARILLPGNQTLIQSVATAMSTLGWPSATLSILGGPMARAVFTCSVLTPGRPRWIDYGPQRDHGACWLAMANATFGPAMDGGPALHCHGVLAGENGATVGGHLVTEACILGQPGLVAHAYAAQSAGFRVTADPSGFNLLAPAQGEPP